MKELEMARMHVLLTMVKDCAEPPAGLKVVPLSPSCTAVVPVKPHPKMVTRVPGDPCKGVTDSMVVPVHTAAHWGREERASKASTTTRCIGVESIVRLQRKAAGEP
jgi:hypothetical protein